MTINKADITLKIGFKPALNSVLEYYLTLSNQQLSVASIKSGLTNIRIS